MKNYIYILGLALSMSSCEDFLTRDNPTGITDAEFWKTSGQVEAALGQCYNLPHGTHHYTSPYISMVHQEGLTDNSYHGADFEGWIVSAGNGTITAEDGKMSELWSARYSIIRKCCRLLENMDKAYFVDEPEREKIRGEAIILRVYYHWELMRYFGLEEGIPIVDHSLTPNENFMARSSAGEVYDWMLTELDRAIAIEDLPFKYDDSRKTKVDRSVAYALKSIIALNAKRYDIARDAAKKVIDSGEYELYYTAQADDQPGKNFRDLFRSVGQNNKERILYSAAGLREAFFRCAGPGLGQQCTVNPLLSFVNSFETMQGKTLDELGPDSLAIYSRDPFYHNNRDPRLFLSVIAPGDSTTFSHYTYNPFVEGPEAIGRPNASRTGFMLKKYIDPLDRNHPYNGSNAFYIIRYAEILLTYVEALIESGDWQNLDVLKYINDIRRRADMIEATSNQYNSQDKVRELLRRERRVELAFEGSRYLDIRRWGIADKVMDGPIYGAINPATGEPIQVETRIFKKNKNEVFPIPQSELIANENMTQNKGYFGNE